jgi:hypothetical protein
MLNRICIMLNRLSIAESSVMRYGLCMTVNKRFPLSLRTTKELRQKLERASAQSGRSLAQEIETRLERSFHQEETVAITVREVLELMRGDWSIGPRMK